MEDRELVRLILDFAQEMNNLQLCYAVLLRRKGADSTDVFRRYREEADRIYTRCLTRRKRSCYYGISYPPFFCGAYSPKHTLQQRPVQRLPQCCPSFHSETVP